MSGAYDALVVGSGFGGAMTAHALVQAGWRVLMLERGGWVERGPASWRPEGSFELTPHYSLESPYRVISGSYRPLTGGVFCVGGPSVFYGCVSMRLREGDFHSEVAAPHGGRWPFGYAELEPYYSRAESLLHVSGDDTDDPTRPPRSKPYPQPPPPLSRVSRRIDAAARSLGLHPFPLPLAINYSAENGRTPCQACRTCDTFACAVEAKNDVATCVVRPLLARGLELRTQTVVTRLIEEGGRITAVEAQDKTRGERVRLHARTVVLSAGALASPHLLLASGLERLGPGGAVVGRHLMRHSNAMVFGVFPRRPDPERQFHKQLALHDYYLGDPQSGVAGKLGCIQQVMTPPVELVKAHMPPVLRTLLGPLTELLTGLLCIAEDEPRPENRLTLDRSRTDAFGLPQAVVEHRYSARDLAARKALVRRAKQVLRRAGALAFHTHAIKTFSHAVGTVRMGTDPATSALDEHCRFRGVENLYVVDGSFMPSSAGVNPSLTIAANALRVGDAIAEEAGR
jgi:choline dehydrogenase-like flavoprotein